MMLTIALTRNKKMRKESIIKFQHENHNDQFCCSAKKKEIDCEIFLLIENSLDLSYKTKLKLMLLRKCLLMTLFQKDSFLPCNVLTFPVALGQGMGTANAAVGPGAGRFRMGSTNAIVPARAGRFVVAAAALGWGWDQPML